MTCHSIVFISEATVNLNEQALLLLLGQARAEHQRAGFTGLLLYHEGQFLQVLEGPEAPLREFFARIALDPRHCKLQKLADGPKPQRDFSGWYMSFKRSASAGPAPPNYLAFSDLLAAVDSTQMQHLLREFLAESNVLLR